VLVKVDEEETRTVGGVLLPSAAQSKPTAGAVVAKGDAETVALGDRVVYSKYAGTEVEVAGKGHVLLKEEDVIGVLPGGSDDVSGLRPLGDRVLIKQAAAEDKTSGGVLLTAEAAEKPTFGTVVAVGPGRKAEGEGADAAPAAPSVSVGATVMYSKYAGTEFDEEDAKYIVVRESDVLASLA
jgi:chaperonin GroES